MEFIYIDYKEILYLLNYINRNNIIYNWIFWFILYLVSFPPPVEIFFIFNILYFKLYIPYFLNNIYLLMEIFFVGGLPLNCCKIINIAAK